MATWQSLNPLRDCHAEFILSGDSSVTEFTLSEILRSLCSLRMTQDEVLLQNDIKRRAQNDSCEGLAMTM